MSLLERLATVQLVPPTPFSPDGRRVLSETLAALVKELSATGIRVFLPAAGTGEFHSLSVDEVLECVGVVRRSVAADAVVVAPVGFALEPSLQIAQSATELGADALLVMPPVHNYLADVGFRDYLSALRAVTPLPLLCYKKGPVPSDKMLLELGRDGLVQGVKYAVNEIDAVNRFIAAAPPSLGVYCGTAERFAPFFMLAGADGYTTGAGNLCPRLTLAMHRALVAGEYAQAMELLRIIRPIEDYRAREADSFNITLLKFALSLKGYEFGPPRAPLRSLTTTEQTEIRALVEPILRREAEQP